MKIAICDDKKEQIAIVKVAVDTYFHDKKGEEVEIDTFDKAFDFLDYQEKKGYDLVMLDICMPGMLGTDVAKEIRQRKDKTEIIFLTTSDEFAVEAFQVNAAHYLLKPFTDADFAEAMDRAMQNIEKGKNKFICLKCAGGTAETVDKDSIIFIEGAAHKQRVFISNGKIIETAQTLNELHKNLEELSGGQFICPFKGYLVNQKAISTIENDKIILKNGKSVPIPRRNFRQIKQAYFDYMFEGRN